MPNASASEVVDLPKNMEYQPDGILSRILLKQASGSVTAFAFDAGQELSEHTCPFNALLHVIDGAASISIGGAAHLVESGQMIKLPAHVPHAVKAPRRFKMLLTMLRAEKA